MAIAITESLLKALLYFFLFTGLAFSQPSPDGTFIIKNRIGLNTGIAFVLDAPQPPSQRDIRQGTQAIVWPLNPLEYGTACRVDTRVAGSPNQWWIFDRDGHIRSATRPDLVLDVSMRGTVGPSSSLAGGELASFYGREVVLWRENYPPSLNQIWITEEGKIMSALNRRLVLDLYGDPDPLSVMHQGARVIVDRARDSLRSSQAWDILANCR